MEENNENVTENSQAQQSETQQSAVCSPGTLVSVDPATADGTGSKSAERESGREKGNENGQKPGKPQKPKKPHRAGWFIGGIVTGAVAAAVLTAVFVGIGTAHMNSGSSSDSVVSSETENKLQLLEAYINQYYYEPDDISVEKEQDGLYHGLLESLDDPYTVYYTKDEMDDLMSETNGSFYGIGAYMTTDKDTDLPAIAGVFSDSPAEKAGLKEGDIIYKVDDESTSGLSLEEVVDKVRGEKGTNVHLTIYREGENDYLEFDITRDEVKEETVTSKMLDDHIGYLQISEFTGVTTDQFETALKDLEDQGMEKLVLDLRSNPGGDVDVVTAIAGDLLPKGLVFYMEDKNGEKTEYTCDGADFDYPLVVLVNGYSASASEILSGAIQDAGIGTIVGTQTYGKGVVQSIFTLDDGSGVKITTADYYTRNGRNINKVGITPDVEVEFDSDAYAKDETDNQLNMAVDILNGKVPASSTRSTGSTAVSAETSTESAAGASTEASSASTAGSEAATDEE